MRGGCLCAPLPRNEITMPLLRPRNQGGREDERPELAWRVASLNVLTLNDGTPAEKQRRRRAAAAEQKKGAAGGHGPEAQTTAEIGMLMPGRTELLEVKLEEAGVLLAGLQEARGRTDGVRAGARYHALRAAAEEGKGGVELWFAKGVPYATAGEKEYYFAPDDLSVLAAGHRFLLVSVRAEAVKLDVLVLHGPIEPQKGKDRQQQEDSNR